MTISVSYTHLDVYKRQRKDLSKIGALIENPPIYENLSARENLKVRQLLLEMCIRDRSLDGVNKKNDVNNTASEAPEKNVKTESEKIDFSKVKIEPL